jgi:hypothetical protein
MLHVLDTLHGWFIRANARPPGTMLFAFASAWSAVDFAVFAVELAALAVELEAFAVALAEAAVDLALLEVSMARSALWNARFARANAFLAKAAVLAPIEGIAQARASATPTSATNGQCRFLRTLFSSRLCHTESIRNARSRQRLAPRLYPAPPWRLTGDPHSISATGRSPSRLLRRSGRECFGA